MSIEAMKQALEALESYHGYMEPLTTVFGGPRVPAEQSTTGKVEKAITALRTAIEQAEKQEPYRVEQDLYGEEIKLYTTPPAAPVQEPVAQDAKQWGNRLNDASWAAVEAWDKDLMGPMSGAVFNNLKGVVRAAILKYLEGYTTPPAAVVNQQLTTEPAAPYRAVKTVHEGKPVYVSEPAAPVQEPEYWNVINPAGNIVASETDAIRGWARIAGSYKPTVEGLLGFHDQGWRVLPKVAPPAAQRQWVGLTADEMLEALLSVDPATKRLPVGFARFANAIEAKLREKNGWQA